MIVNVLQLNKLGSDGSNQLHLVAMEQVRYETSCVCVSNGLVLVAMEQICYLTIYVCVSNGLVLDIVHFI